MTEVTSTTNKNEHTVIGNYLKVLWFTKQVDHIAWHHQHVRWSHRWLHKVIRPSWKITTDTCLCSKLNNITLKLAGVAPHGFNIDIVNVDVCCVDIVLDFTVNIGLFVFIIVALSKIIKLAHHSNNTHSTSLCTLYVNYTDVITVAVIFIILKP